MNIFSTSVNGKINNWIRSQTAIQTPFCVFTPSSFFSPVFVPFFLAFIVGYGKTVYDIKRNWVLCVIECVCVGVRVVKDELVSFNDTKRYDEKAHRVCVSLSLCVCVCVMNGIENGKNTSCERKLSLCFVSFEREYNMSAIQSGSSDVMTKKFHSCFSFGFLYTFSFSFNLMLCVKSCVNKIGSTFGECYRKTTFNACIMIMVSTRIEILIYLCLKKTLQWPK